MTGARPAERVLASAGLALVCASALLAALVELFLVPLYAGSVLVPVSVLLAVLTNIALPRLAREFVPSRPAVGAPFALWMVVVVVVGFTTRPEGDVVLPGGGGVEAVSWGLFLGGLVAGLVTVFGLRLNQRAAISR